jgi:hypothetical protein
MSHCLYFGNVAFRGILCQIPVKSVITDCDAVPDLPFALAVQIVFRLRLHRDRHWRIHSLDRKPPKASRNAAK